MKKKIVLFLSIIMLTLICVVPFGCSSNSNYDDGIKYNTKYVIEYFYNESEDDYDVNWTFYRDGTCFLYFYVSTSTTVHVEATYYYTYEDGNLFCFLKEYEEGEYNNVSSLNNYVAETYVFGYTKNAIMDLKTGLTYLNINYANDLEFEKISSNYYSSYRSMSRSYRSN